MNPGQMIGRMALGMSAAIQAHPIATRWLLAGPGALVAGIVTIMAMPVWLPAGTSGINDIAFPILLAPLLWAVPFFFACLEENLVRCTLVMSGAIVGQGALVALAMAA